MPDFRKGYLAAPDRYAMMEYRRCGNSGLKLSALSLGMWHNFGNLTPYAQMRDIVCTAFDHGVTHFDLANNYGPEYGEAERNMAVSSETTFVPTGTSSSFRPRRAMTCGRAPMAITGAASTCSRLLTRGSSAWAWIMWTSSINRMDSETPLDETMGALASAVEQGKALYVGLSRYDEPTLRRATEILDARHVPYVINQYRYNILERGIVDGGSLAASAELRRGIITFSPLAQGLLTSRYLDGVPADSRMAHDPRYLKRSALTPEVHARLVALDRIARDRGQTLAQMALSWQLHDPRVTGVLIGASRPGQIFENLKALDEEGWSPEELASIDEAALGKAFEAEK